MTTIHKLILKNFKRFESIEIDLDKDRTVIVGDNECGKSSILLALDLVLSASRTRVVESIGLEALFNCDTVEKFLRVPKKYDDLPNIVVEAYLTTDGKHTRIKQGFDLSRNPHRRSVLLSEEIRR